MREQKDVLKMFEILARDNPEPKSELNYTNAFTLLVAIVLSTIIRIQLSIITRRTILAV